MEDRDIIDLLNARSESAIVALAEQYGEYCYAVAFRLLQNEEDAKECVSDAYLGAWNTIPPTAPSCLRTYLGRLVRNNAAHTLQKRSADKRGGGEVSLILDELATCIPSSHNTEAEVDALLLNDVLNRFLSELSVLEKWIFVHRCWYAESVSDIANALGIRQSRVRGILYRTRKKLKNILEREGLL